MLAETYEIRDDRREHRVSNFTLPATNGDTVTLYKFAGRKRVVLFFPATMTDAASAEYANQLTRLRAELDEVDTVVLPILDAAPDTAKVWAEQNVNGYAALGDAGAQVRNRYYQYFEVDTTHALLVLLDIYCAPLVVSHAADAKELMPPAEIPQWLNMLVCACSE